jgi:hypothetical protein
MWARPHHGDEGRLFVQALTEAGDKYVDELVISHGISEFAELVSDGVEALAVRADGGITLGGVAELVVEAGDACVNVILEELPK